MANLIDFAQDRKDLKLLPFTRYFALNLFGELLQEFANSAPTQMDVRLDRTRMQNSMSKRIETSTFINSTWLRVPGAPFLSFVVFMHNEKVSALFSTAT